MVFVAFLLVPAITQVITSRSIQSDSESKQEGKLKELQSQLAKAEAANKKVRLQWGNIIRIFVVRPINKVCRIHFCVIDAIENKRSNRSREGK